MVRFYVVSVGSKPGIYQNIRDLQNAIRGHPSPQYKTFETLKLAQEYFQGLGPSVQGSSVQGSSIHGPKVQEKSSSSSRAIESKLGVIPLLHKTLIYTRGEEKSGVGGFGLVIITSDGSKITAHGRVPFEVSCPQVAELYAIYVGLSLIVTDVVVNVSYVYSCDCLSTDDVVAWCEGLEYGELIETLHRKIVGREATFQVIEESVLPAVEARKLAQEGLHQDQDLIIYENGILREHDPEE